MHNTNRSAFFLTLLQIKGIGNQAILKLMSEYQAESLSNVSTGYDIIIKAFINSKRIEIPELDEFSRLNQSVLMRVKKWQKEGVYIIDTLSHLYPRNLLELKNRPVLLFCRGNIELLNKRSITVIGSRVCDNKLYQYSYKVAKQCINRGFSVISGLALGCDEYAHLGALSVSGNTIAILPSGFDHIYPKNNIKLFSNIIKNNGLAISEYSPDTPVSKFQLLRRDILQAQLCDALILINGLVNSGSRHAVEEANKLNKPVSALYIDKISNSNDLGNIIIRNGATKIASNIDLNLFVDNLKGIGNEFN